MLYNIHETSGAQPHLVATIHGHDVAQHIVDQLETQYPNLQFALSDYNPAEAYLIHWHDASIALS